MKPIIILQHSAEAPPGFLADALESARVGSEVVDLYEGQPLPDPDRIGALVSLGGPMGAYDESDFGFLAPEKVLLRHAVADNIPVLGICLGCQLLADALGGRAYAAGEMEIMFAPLQLIGPAEQDPVVRTLAEPVLSFHGDTWDPPPGATVLARSARYLHAFRLGSALGVQPHPEAPSSIARRWFARFSQEQLKASGVDGDEVLAEMAAGDAASAERSARLFAAWLTEIGIGAP